jgi:hypothetical protein
MFGAFVGCYLPWKIAPSWGIAMGIYIIGYISYGVAVAFYAAALRVPRLAPDTRYPREPRVRHERGKISAEVYEHGENLEKNGGSNISMAHASFTRDFLLMTTRFGRRLAAPATLDHCR